LEVSPTHGYVGLQSRHDFLLCHLAVEKVLGTNMMSKLVKLIADCVQPVPNPSVYIGGGIDSAVILHHLREKSEEKIYTYTFGFKGQPNEFDLARQKADFFETKHKAVVIEKLLPKYPTILRELPFPRFTLWVYWVAEQAHKDGRQTCYVGEGADEHFGGYWYKPRKSYVENWVGLFQWGVIFNLKIEAPFLKLDWRETYNYYDYEQHKYYLRKAYKKILPDFILEQKKRPATIDFQLFWQNELCEYFPNVNPHSNQEIRELWQALATKMWIEEKQVQVI